MSGRIRSVIREVGNVDEDVAGKHVVLLDDVVSTGATMNEAIRALLQAGASEITPLALAYHPLDIRSAVTNRELRKYMYGAKNKRRLTRAGSW
jgi:phosphoribosylpyrophosphate synthetase